MPPASGIGEAVAFERSANHLVISELALIADERVYRDQFEGAGFGLTRRWPDAYWKWTGIAVRLARAVRSQCVPDGTGEAIEAFATAPSATVS